MRLLFALLFVPLAALADPSTIKIGAILPLTGDGAFWGESERKGIELAVKDLNALATPGQPKIEVIFEDDKCEPKLSVSAYQKLIDLDKVSAIVGPGCSSGAMAVGPRANHDHTVLLTCTEADEISNIGKFIFRMWVPNGRVAIKLVNYAHEKLQAKRFGILTMQNDYGVSISTAGRKEVERLGGVIVAEERYAPSTSDVRAELLRIKSKKPDVILLGNYIKDGIAIIKQLRELKIQTPILAGSAANTAEFASGVGALGDGIIIADLPDTIGEEFRQRWKMEFSAEWPGMGSCAAMAYDSMGMLRQVIDKGSKSPDEVRAALAAIPGYKGVTGLLSFDSEQNLTLTHKLFVLRNGKSDPLAD